MTIAKATDQIWRFPVKIQNLLNKLVQVQVQRNHLEKVTWPPPRGLRSYWLYHGLQARYENYVSIFLFPPTNGPGHSSNEWNRRRSSNLLFSIHQWFCHIGSESWNFKFPSSDSESPWNFGLESLSTKWIGGGHPTCSSCLNHQFCHIGIHSRNFTFPSSDSESPPNLGLEPLSTKSIREGHLTCSSCPNQYVGYSRCHTHNQAFSWPDSWSPWKMGLGTCWTVQFRGGQILKPPGFRQCFGFYCLIRKCTNLGTLDSESPPKGLSGDTHIFLFEPYPIYTKNTPYIIHNPIW